MAVMSMGIKLNTGGRADILDITPQVQDVVRTSGLKAGIVTVFCPSSTSALTTIEYEPGCLSDLRRLFDHIIPQNQTYAHDQAWHDGNGHSHIRAALLKPDLTIPFVDHKLTLGTWQQIIYIDFDNRPRRRQLVAQVIGE